MPRSPLRFNLYWGSLLILGGLIEVSGPSHDPGPVTLSSSLALRLPVWVIHSSRHFPWCFLGLSDTPRSLPTLSVAMRSSVVTPRRSSTSVLWQSWGL